MLIRRCFRIWISKEFLLVNEVGRAYYHMWEERIVIANTGSIGYQICCLSYHYKFTLDVFFSVITTLFAGKWFLQVNLFLPDFFCLLGEEHNFLQLSAAEINSRNEPYDYGSIMHYGKSTFAKEVNKVTILPKRDPRTSFIPDIGQRQHLSVGDIRQISKMYRCTGRKMFTKV